MNLGVNEEIIKFSKSSQLRILHRRSFVIWIMPEEKMTVKLRKKQEPLLHRQRLGELMGYIDF